MFLAFTVLERRIQSAVAGAGVFLGRFSNVFCGCCIRSVWVTYNFGPFFFCDAHFRCCIFLSFSYTSLSTFLCRTHRETESRRRASLAEGSRLTIFTGAHTTFASILTSQRPLPSRAPTPTKHFPAAAARQTARRCSPPGSGASRGRSSAAAPAFPGGTRSAPPRQRPRCRARSWGRLRGPGCATAA